MTDEQSAVLDATVEQAEAPVDLANSEQVTPEDVPPAQEVTEPVLSGSTVDGGTEVQIGPDHTVITVTEEASTTTSEPMSMSETEETIPMSEEQTQVTDVAKAVGAIRETFQTFEIDFATAKASHEDILRQIIDLMAERTRLLIALKDELTAENKLLAKFNAVEAGA